MWKYVYAFISTQSTPTVYKVCCIMVTKSSPSIAIVQYMGWWAMVIIQRCSVISSGELAICQLLFYSHWYCHSISSVPYQRDQVELCIEADDSYWTHAPSNWAEAWGGGGGGGGGVRGGCAGEGVCLWEIFTYSVDIIVALYISSSIHNNYIYEYNTQHCEEWPQQWSHSM